MKAGDLVRIRKTAIDHLSTNWFIWHAEHMTPLLVIEELNKSFMKLLKPNGDSIFIHRSHLTKRMW
jgi:hypothetical protein|tara:strand:- start:1217 stop:1414 length:198 start_codon:yes stop_codon:yes gene_type:complete